MEEGAGFISIYETKEGTFLKFNKVFRCFDYYFIEFIRSSYVVSFCEFVDDSGQDYSFCIVECTATFECCVFVDALNKPVDLHNSPAIRYINCVSNKNKPSLTYSPLQKSEFEMTFSLNKIICNQIPCSRFVHFIPIYYISLIELVVI